MVKICRNNNSLQQHLAIQSNQVVAHNHSYFNVWRLSHHDVSVSRWCFMSWSSFIFTLSKSNIKYSGIKKLSKRFQVITWRIVLKTDRICCDPIEPLFRQESSTPWPSGELLRLGWVQQVARTEGTESMWKLPRFCQRKWRPTGRTFARAGWGAARTRRWSKTGQTAISLTFWTDHRFFTLGIV